MSEANVGLDRLVIILNYLRPALDKAIKENPRQFIHDVKDMKNCTVTWTTASENLIELRDLIDKLSCHSE